MEKRLKHYDIYFLVWVKFIGCISKMEFDYLKANPQIGETVGVNQEQADITYLYSPRISLTQTGAQTSWMFF